MAHILKQIGDTPNIPFYMFECDDSSDLKDISLSMVPMGSRCYVINEGKTYALNSKQEWKLVPSSGSGSGGGTDEPSTPSDDIIYDGGSED